MVWIISCLTCIIVGRAGVGVGGGRGKAWALGWQGETMGSEVGCGPWKVILGIDVSEADCVSPTKNPQSMCPKRSASA